MSEAQWNFIEGAARQRGVSDEAIRKWRERGRVPYRWRWPIAQDAMKAGMDLDELIFDAPEDDGGERAAGQGDGEAAA